MFYSELINKAIDIAYKAHHGQIDKAGRPYFLHPVIVAQSMNTESEICAALLHDVVEDTNITLSELEKIFPQEIIQAINLLTHKDGVSYEDYILAIKSNPIAKKVKLADIAHNLDITRLTTPELLAEYGKRKAKYNTALQILNNDA